MQQRALTQRQSLSLPPPSQITQAARNGSPTLILISSRPPQRVRPRWPDPSDVFAPVCFSGVVGVAGEIESR